MPASMVLRETLEQGGSTLGLSLTTEQVDQLLAYLELLGKWGKVYNLTAVRDPADMLVQHVLDSLAVVLPLRRELVRLRGLGAAPRLLDVGSGAGLPGVVLAISTPGLSVICVDTVAKKAAFVRQVAASLRLPGLRGEHARVESMHGPFDVIMSRAFAALPQFVALSESSLAPGGFWLAMKGKHPEDELEALPPGRRGVSRGTAPGARHGRAALHRVDAPPRRPILKPQSGNRASQPTCWEHVAEAS